MSRFSAASPAASLPSGDSDGSGSAPEYVVVSVTRTIIKIVCRVQPSPDRDGRTRCPPHNTLLCRANAIVSQQATQVDEKRALLTCAARRYSCSFRFPANAPAELAAETP